MTALVNIIGLLLIVFIIWWFWFSKSKKTTQASQSPVDIKVEGGIYIPDTIEAQAGETIKLRFTREDPSPCAEAVIFDSLEISHNLPLKRASILTLKVENPGRYEFTCPMGMYRGNLIIK